VGGRMKGGVIIVDGDVKGEVGESMVGGEIYITGDVAGTIGGDLRGGKIFVAGKMPELHDNVKVRPLGTKELEAVKDYHSRFKFRKFQAPEALNDFRLIEKV
jgi:formylmethanofuran dehydrogenase subunit C